jgi:hypothetical protein
MSSQEYPGYFAVSQLGPAATMLPLDTNLAPQAALRPPAVIWNVPEYLETPDLFLNARLLGAAANCLGADVVSVNSYEDTPAPVDCLTDQADLMIGMIPDSNDPNRSSLARIEFGRTSILQAVGTVLDNAPFTNDSLTLTGAFAKVLSDGLRNGLAELASEQSFGPIPRQMAHLLGATPLVAARVDLERATS